MSGLDLDAYLARIGYSGPRTATLATLEALAALHPQAIPFENLDVLLQRPIRLDLGALSEKLVQQRRGGYCFEQNGLLQAALAALGFTVRSLAARVEWGNGDDVTLRPRTHMVLLVSLPAGDYIVDAGFGGLTLTAPLKRELGVTQSTPHADFRLADVDGELRLEAKTAGDWSPVYLVSMQEQGAADWDVVNWYTSTHPQSIFINSLIAARSLEDRRLALLNNELRIYRTDGTSERRELATAEELETVLSDAFGIALPDGARARLQALIPASKVR